MDDKPLNLDGEGFPGESKASPISFALDDYEDIFSDFDPRPYLERMLSDDFLYELKRAALGKEEKGLVLTLLLPKEKRNPGHEKVIVERLRGHFRRNYRRRAEKVKSETWKGGVMVGLGVAFMFIATWLLLEFEKTLWSSFVVVLLEPAGWFTFWEGLNLILFRREEGAPDLDFYRKMAGVKIGFGSAPTPPLPAGLVR
ncbi:MAG TPA: hypothetical protein VMV05_06195 [bacterium]|nr:hypothetical protein [bacterium]